jgi:hypothetical protein
MRNRNIRTVVASALVAVMLLLSLFSVALAAGPTADASRTIDPQMVEPGGEVDITVEFTSLVDHKVGFVLQEVFPKGWGFTRGTDDANNFKNSTIEWLWTGVEASATKTVTYTLTVPIDAEPGNYTISGTVTAGGVVNPVGGDTIIRVSMYDLTMAVAPGGSGTATDLTNTSPYTAGTGVNIQAVANSGYRFLNWSAPAGTFGNATAATTTFTMPAQNVTVTANFVAVYSLTMAVSPGSSGTATDLTGASPYKANTVVNIQAVAAAGYRFLNWTAPVGTFGNATAVTTTFTMPAQNVTVTANFGLVPPPVYPTVTTKAASGITTSSATLNMNYTVGNYTSVEVCFAYKKSTGSVWTNTTWVSKAASGTHAAPVAGLTSGTKYDFKAQVRYDSTVIGGTTLQFTTSTLPPSVGGCFIATAAYGTPTAKQIDVLREFRDVVLLNSTVGSQFVSLYYRFSPPVADVIAGNEFLRTLVRELLVDPIVWVVEATGDMWRN